MNKKIDLICEKLLQRIEKQVQEDCYHAPFKGCKTVEDVLNMLGCDEHNGWISVLYEVGYSLNYCYNEVPNLSPRFCRLFDKVLAKLEENEEKVMKLANLYNE